MFLNLIIEIRIDCYFFFNIKSLIYTCKTQKIKMKYELFIKFYFILQITIHESRSI